jgi:putative glutamine amidotransferase
LDLGRVQIRRSNADDGHMRPLIGVTTSELRPSAMGTARSEMALGMTYMRTLDAAGAMPVVLPPVGDPEQLIDRLDGICLSGGPDVDPAAYGARERHPELGPTEPALDAFELALAKAALERGMPILAVCRGAQALNVACGGTLHQHLPGHRQAAPAGEPAHEVALTRDSRLARITRTRTLAVNSFHHQAVDRLGAGLRIVGRAPDGTVEAIEGTGFVMGVQWHAEVLVAHRRLFQALVEAASGDGLRLAA